MKNTYTSLLLASSLIIASGDLFAAPRNLLPAESRIEFTVKEMGVPVTGEWNRGDIVNNDILVKVLLTLTPSNNRPPQSNTKTK